MCRVVLKLFLWIRPQGMKEYGKLYDKTNQNTTLKKKTCYFIGTLKELLLSDMARVAHTILYHGKYYL